MNTSSSVLLTTRQRRTRAFRDGLLGQILLINRDRIGLDHGIVLVVQVEDIRCDSQAHRVAFTSVSVTITRTAPSLPDHPPVAASSTIRPCYIRGNGRWIQRLERVTTGKTAGLPLALVVDS